MVGVLKNIKKMETTIKKMTKSYLEKLQSIEHSEGDILKIIPPAIKLLLCPIFHFLKKDTI